MLALAAALAVALLAAPAALAGVRTAVVTDARDGWTTATGQPSTPDLLRAEVTYDTTGTLTMNVDFAEDVRGLATDRAYAGRSATRSASRPRSRPRPASRS